jgi:hypothetical protein
MVITYPGWRGNSLHTNGTAPNDNPGSRGMDYNANNDTWSFPWGMQWMYPCKSLPKSPWLAPDLTLPHQVVVCRKAPTEQNGR